MKKSFFLLALIFVGAITISASLEERIHGKWYVYSMKMQGHEEEFKDYSVSPWMVFKNHNVLLLGEPGREVRESKWTYDRGIGILHLDSFGEELEFKVTEFTDSKLVIKAHNGIETVVKLVLRRPE